MVDAPTWFVMLFNVVLIVCLICVFILLWSWRTVKRAEGKMIAEIWEPSGYPVRHLVQTDKSGKTVEVDGITYRLPREDVDEDQYERDEKGNVVIDGEGKRIRKYPSHRYTRYPASAPLGLKSLQVTLRIESWAKDNPEPIRPYYGKLTVTGLEWTAAKREIQASALAMDVQESEAREKEMRRGLLNLPNKLILYLLAGGGCLGSVICLVYLMQIAGRL